MLQHSSIPKIMPVIDLTARARSDLISLYKTEHPEDREEMEMIEQCIDAYLQQLIHQHDRLTLLQSDSLNMRLPIDKLYVALTVDTTVRSERASYLEELNIHLQQLWCSAQLFLDIIHHKLLMASHHLENEQHYSLKTIQWDDFILTPHVLTPNEQSQAFFCLDQRIQAFDEQKRCERQDVKKTQRLTLQQAYNAHTHLIILGDPGSGKTTLARWLAVNMAKAYLGKNKQLMVPKYQVDPQVESRHDAQQVMIGIRVLIPLFITVSDYARYSDEYPENESLDVFIQHQYPDTYTGLLAFLKQGKALIIFDGFDEVSCRKNRQKIINNIHAFLAKWHDTHISYPSNVSPFIDHGNRFMITSRIAGNYTSTFCNDFCRVTIEPLSEKMVNQFFKRWFDALKKTYPDLPESEKKATTLIRRVISDQRLRDLVKTPQLASLVAYVYVVNHYQLPSTKSSLYQTAIDHFIRLWQARMVTSMESDINFIEKLLEYLAYQIHGRSGPISEAELRAVCMSFLTDPDTDADVEKLSAYANTLLLIISEDVGLIVPYGTNTYRFIHRQFQEYLAARHLIAKHPSLNTLVIEFSEKLMDLDWHEPLRLALDFFCQKNPQDWLELVVTLLALKSNQSVIVPVVTYLLVDALSSNIYAHIKATIHQAPLYEMIKRILISLCLSYGHQWSIRSRAMMQHSQSSFAKLLAAGFHEETRGVCEVLLTQSEIAPALARLLVDCHYQHHSLMPNLMSALTITTFADYDWAVAKLLKQHTLTSTSLQPVAQNTIPTLILDRQRLDQLLQSEWCQSYENFAVLVTLLPAYENKHAIRSRNDYQLKVSYLSTQKELRDEMKALFEYDWGDDSVYNIAVFLDIQGQQNKKKWNQSHAYQPEQLYFSTPLLDLLEAASSASTRLEAFKEMIEREYQRTHNLHVQVECLLALMAFNEPLSAYSSMLSKALQTHLMFRLTRLQYHLQDMIYCTHQNYTQELMILNDALPPSLRVFIWNAYAQSIYELTGSLCVWSKIPLSVDKFKNSLPLTVLSEIIATTVQEQHNTEGDDRYALKSLKPLLENNRLDWSAWQQIFDSISFTISPHSAYLYWPIDHLPTHNDDRSIESTIQDIHWHTLDLLSHLPENAHFILESLIRNALQPVLYHTAELIPELLTVVIITFQRNNKQCQELINKIDPCFVLDHTWMKQLRDRIDALVSPYYQVRAWYRLALSQGNEKAKLFFQACERVKDIINISEQAEMRVLLAQGAAILLLPNEAQKTQSSLVNLALETVRQLPYPGQKAVLLTRLSLFFFSSTSTHLIKEGINALLSVDNTSYRAKLGRLLLPLWQITIDPDCQTAIREFYFSFRDPYEAAYAQQRTGKLIALATELVLKKTPDAYPAWVPFMVAAKASDWQKDGGSFVTSHDHLWRALSIHAESHSVTQLLENTEGNGITVNLVAALSINRLYHLGKCDILYSLFPYLKHASKETIPLLNQWLLADHRELRLLAILLLTEMHKQLPYQYIPEIIELLTSPHDLWRYRVEYFMYQFFGNQSSPLKLSILGEPTYWALAQQSTYHQSNAPAIGLRIRWMGEHLLQDDPLLMQAWLTRLNSPDIDTDAFQHYKAAINLCHFATSLVIDLLLEQFTVVNSKTQNVILYYFMRLTNNDTNGSWNQWKGFFQLFHHTENPLFHTQFMQHASYQEGCHQLMALFQKELNEGTPIDYHTLKVNWDRLCKILPADLQRTCTEESMLKHKLNDIYLAEYVCQEKIEMNAHEEFAAFFVKHTLSLEALIELVSQILPTVLEERLNDRFFDNLMGITVSIAHLLPWQFRNVLNHFIDVKGTRILDQLVLIIKHKNSFPARGMAVSLFGFIALHDQTLFAIQSGIQDVTFVRSSVISMLASLALAKHVNPSLTTHLIECLVATSTVLAYIAIKCLTVIACSESTESHVRQHILHVLNQACMSTSAKRYVILMHLPKPIDGIPYLAQLMIQAIMEIAHFPNYSYDYQRKMEKMQDEVNLAAIAVGDTEALINYMQQHPEKTHWKSDFILKLLPQADSHAHVNIMVTLLEHPTLKAKIPQEIGELLNLAVKKGYCTLLTALIQRHSLLVAAVDLEKKLLHVAILNDQINVCKILLRECTDVNQTNEDNETALFIAVNRNEYDICQVLLTYGAGLHHRTHTGKTPLSTAKIKDKEIRDLLVTYAYSLSQVCGHHSTESLLLFAAAAGYRVMCQMLLETKVNIDVRNKEGQTPLMLAVINNHDKICQLLLESGSLVDLIDHNNDSALYHASAKGSLIQCRLLIERHADANLPGRNRGLPLHNTCWNGVLECTQYLLPQTRNINAMAIEGATCLHLAVIDGSSMEMVEFLVNQGADLELQFQGMSIGTLAYIRGNTRQVTFFNTRGYGLNRAELSNISPSYFILKDPSVATVLQHLDQLGVDLSLTGADGETWLILAVKHNLLEVIQILISELWIDPRIPNAWGETALAIAEQKKLSHVIVLISEHIKMITPETTIEFEQSSHLIDNQSGLFFRGNILNDNLSTSRMGVYNGSHA